MNIIGIVIASAAVVGIIGIVIGVLLGVASEKFKVEVDEREILVRNELPGNNCGGCGYAGCDALAKAIAAGWYEAINYMKSNPDDAIAIIAKRMGEKPESIKSELNDVKFYDQAGNKAYFGTADNQGDFYKVTALAAKLWKDLGLVNKDVDAASIIDGSFLDAK